MENLGMLILRAVLRWQSAGQPVVLVTIARTWGLSSRPQGSLMAINERGETKRWLREFGQFVEWISGNETRRLII